ncbi:MAG: TIM barrel protein [Clostridia bacterium]
MKIAVAIAPENALASAFVVFRGIEESIKKAAVLGYDGIELALMNKEQTDINRVKSLIKEYNLEIPVVSTGQVFAGLNLWFTNPDINIRNKTVEIFKGLIELASEFGAMVNMGRVRGPIHAGETIDVAEKRFIEVMEQLSDYGSKYGVELILEPVNRYEINFVNSVDEGADLLNKLNRNNVKLMPDVFHMNIEDQSIVGTFIKHFNRIAYIHFADSNRLAPGQGHLHFPDIISALNSLGYKGWVSVEILPEPDPDTAAKQSIEYLRTLIPRK